MQSNCQTGTDTSLHESQDIHSRDRARNGTDGKGHAYVHPMPVTQTVLASRAQPLEPSLA